MNNNVGSFLTQTKEVDLLKPTSFVSCHNLKTLLHHKFGSIN